MGQFTVVQDVYAFDHWQAAAQVLTEVLGLHPITANQRARKSGGFLAENLERDTAEQIQQACEAQGLATHVVAATEVVALPTLTRVHELSIAEDALWICQSTLGDRQPIDWQSILLMTAYHVVKTESYHHWSTSGPHMGGSEWQLKTEKYSKDYVEHVADIFGSSPDGTFLRLRVGSRELNYQEALGPGTSVSQLPETGELHERKHQQAYGADPTNPRVVPDTRLGNFRLVLARIHARAVRAYVPPETLVLFGGAAEANCRLYDLPTLEEFDAYNRWLLQKMRIHSGPAASPWDG
jgi:hypothetical protein